MKNIKPLNLLGEDKRSWEYGYAVHSSGEIMAIHDNEAQTSIFFGSCKGDSVTSVLNSFIPDNVFSLLLKAVNNRTVERNYFRLYSQFLEGTISGEDFDREIEEHEDDYVIIADNKPKIEDVKTALQLASKIRGMRSSSDLSTLFSFDPDETDKLLSIPEVSDASI